MIWKAASTVKAGINGNLAPLVTFTTVTLTLQRLFLSPYPVLRFRI